MGADKSQAGVAAFVSKSDLTSLVSATNTYKDDKTGVWTGYYLSTLMSFTMYYFDGCDWNYAACRVLNDNFSFYIRFMQYGGATYWTPLMTLIRTPTTTLFAF